MDKICTVLKMIVGLLLGLLVAVVCVTVFFRYVLNASLYWATEVPNFILVWIVFLGSVIAFHEKKHIAFDLITEAAPPPLKRLLGIASTLVVLVFVLGLVWYGVGLVAKTMDSPSEALKFPQGVLYACLPVSMSLIAISAVQQLIGYVRGPRERAPP